ncbi:cell agglutination protein Mam3 [Basidiobolus ranarum]|uniref:Cell agglutination protein Mam3 n=1 Tax=Basidiobolus ranarum TaxID=34480 RepID=A0ABR2VPN0_9FUNG
MTPMKFVFSISFESKLDRKTMTDILRAGHSRVPIYKGSENNIVGVLLVKNLILLNPDDAVPISEVKIYDSPKVSHEDSLFDLLNRFQEGGSHMAQVIDPSNPSSPIGIITLEDVLEEIIQEEIVDETDVFVDVAKKVRVIRAMNPRMRRRSTLGDVHGVPNNVAPNQKSDQLIPPVENKKWPKGLSFSSNRNDVPEHLKYKHPGLTRSNSSDGCEEHRENSERPNERTALLGTSV